MGQETPAMTEPLTKGYFSYYLKNYASTAGEGGCLCLFTNISVRIVPGPLKK